MKKIGPQILSHIKCAKDWLDKAASEYASENKLKGELILSLAQAEVKHAWETSLQQKNTPYVKQGTFVKYKIASIAAGVLLVISACGLFLVLSTREGQMAQKSQHNPLPVVINNSSDATNINNTLSVQTNSTAPKVEGQEENNTVLEQTKPQNTKMKPEISAAEKTSNNNNITEEKVAESIDWSKLENNVRDILQGN